MLFNMYGVFYLYVMYRTPQAHFLTVLEAAPTFGGVSAVQFLGVGFFFFFFLYLFSP